MQGSGFKPRPPQKNMHYTLIYFNLNKIFMIYTNFEPPFKKNKFVSL